MGNGFLPERKVLRVPNRRALTPCAEGTASTLLLAPDHDSTSADSSPSRLTEQGAGKIAPRILVAEDDYELRSLIADALRRRGSVVYEVHDGLQLRARLDAWGVGDEELGGFDIVISDVRMPGLTGFEALSGAARRHPNLPIIVITAFGDVAAYRQAARLGAAAFLDKPLDLDHLCRCVERILTGRFKDDETDPFGLEAQ